MREIDRIGELIPRKFDALLVAGGTRPARNSFMLAVSRAAQVVAVDGGVQHLRHFSVSPSLVIGDLDSARSEDLSWARRRRARVVLIQDQNSSDMDKALDFCRKRNWKNIVISACDGSRPDHFLYALGRSHSRSGTYLTFLFRNSVAIALAGRKSLKLQLGRNKPLSWFGLPRARGVALSGVRWPLPETELQFDQFVSLSNQSIEDSVLFRQQSGKSLIIIPTGKV